MTGSRELVGPVDVVSFHGGPDTWAQRRAKNFRLPRVTHKLPRNTLDPRYRACVFHRLACDCREAELAENINEARDEYLALRNALHRAIHGHTVETCRCGACGIARETLHEHLSGLPLKWKTSP
jgi:hypothetical protein